MKKKVIAMLLVVSMLLASTGCSAYGQVLKLAENYEPPIVEEVIEEVELPEEEILEEDIPNDEEAFERMEEGITEAEDVTTVTFENGKSFQLTEAAIEGEVELGYKLEGTESILEVAVTTDYPASQLAGDMSELMKENSGEIPLVDNHEEGIYITGIMEDVLMLVFIREDGEGQTYVLSVYTVDTDNALDITNGIISDFLASGIAGYAARTEYGEAITELNTDELYYTIPDGYSCTYTCEYFSYFDNGEYQATLYEDQDEELERFFAGGMVISVDENVDMIQVAQWMASDDVAAISGMLEKKEIQKVTDDQARIWSDSDAMLWAVVVKPWILVQQRRS